MSFSDTYLARAFSNGTVTPVMKALGSCKNDPAGMLRDDHSFRAIHIDAMNGTALIEAHSQIEVASNPGQIHQSLDELIEVRGLPNLLDVVLTYQPPSMLSFNVPAKPEGLGGSDSFSIYTGDTRHAADLSQASPLQCAVPTGRPPVPGEILTVPDTLPDPAPNDARYYLAVANYQGQKRAGRSAVNGVLQGRNAGILPGCQ